jgi:uncharacterized membrane protein
MASASRQDRSKPSAWPLLLATAGVLLLAVLLATAPAPALAPSLPGIAGGEVVRATVLRVIERRDGSGEGQAPFVRLEVRADEGTIKGAVLAVEERAIGTTGQVREFRAGDHVLLNYSRRPDGTDAAFIAEYVRAPQLVWLAAIFAVAIGVVGGFQGLRSLLGMAISFIIILRFIIPHILAGNPPVLVTISGALLVMVATLYLAHGLSRKTTAALAGTLLALLLTGALGEVFIGWTRLTGLASEQAVYLPAATGGAINLQGLLLCGLIIGTLGVLDDVSASQASAVFELYDANPALSARELTTRAMRIGRDHIAATVNTLFLAYAGSSLPLLLLLSTRPEPLSTLVNREFIAVEIVGALVGSLGLVAAVPLTTAAAAFAAKRQPAPAPAPLPRRPTRDGHHGGTEARREGHREPEA